jgi:hypothetical protein
LNHLVCFDPVNIAHEFYLNLLSVFPPQRKVLISNVFVLLESLKGQLVGGDVFE